jgi:hypothetical protein
MGFIANIAFNKGGIKEQPKSFGSLWYTPDTHHASILLKGFRFGQCYAKPFAGVDAPYLEGDIVVPTGEYTEGIAKEYMWCGWMWTCSDQRGALYNFVLEIDPSPIVRQKEMREEKDIKGVTYSENVNIRGTISLSHSMSRLLWHSAQHLTGGIKFSHLGTL